MRAVVGLVVIVGGSSLIVVSLLYSILASYKFTLGRDPQRNSTNFLLLLDFGSMNSLWGGIQHL